jgi:hypothetical protein
MNWMWKKRTLLAPPIGSQHVEALLLELEMAETEERRVRLRGELERLVEVDADAARAYEAHCLLERELRALFKDPELRVAQRVSPLRALFRRLRCGSGAVG